MLFKRPVFRKEVLSRVSKKSFIEVFLGMSIPFPEIEESYFSKI